MATLPSILSPADLPLVELQALVRDGEAYAIGGSFAPIDQPDSPAVRAGAIIAPLGDSLEIARLIIDRSSAAWVWGALPLPPGRHDFCVRIEARVRPAAERRMSVREVVIDDDSLASFGSVLVTTPVRTMLDLARFSEHFSSRESSVIATLSAAHGVTLDECIEFANRRRNLPNKRRAIDRIAHALQGSISPS